MELLLIVLLLVIFFTLLSFKSSVNVALKEMQEDLSDLRKLMLKNNATQQTSVTADTEVTVKKETPAKKEAWQSGFKIHEEPVEKRTETPEPLTPEVKSVPQDALKQESAMPSMKSGEARSVITAPVKNPEREVKPSFFERHPDLEKFIGENLISKVGIAILVLAIAYFVKFAIDKNWIGPVARVGIGILCGGILVALAHRLRKSYQAFSSVLVGGGLAIFYFTIALAYHQFHLFSQTASFVIMVVITMFAVVLSLLYDRQELAIIALVGGFATPLLVSDGGGNFRALFSYLLILNTGLLAIAYYRSWRLLNIISFGFTTLLFFLWTARISSDAGPDTLKGGFFFATLFYILFFGVNILHNIKQSHKFIASDFSILLANTALYYSAGIYFLTRLAPGQYNGLFTAGLGAFNLAASWLLFRNKQVDRNILFLLIGITVSFVSLTAPVQLEGNNITLFWAAECVLLYWLYQRSSIRLFNLTSLAVWLLMLSSLVIDLFQFYFIESRHAPIIFNKSFATTLFCAICSYVLFILRTRHNTIIQISILKAPVNTAILVASLVLFFLTGALEINYQFEYYFGQLNVGFQYLLLYTYVFVLMLNLVKKVKIAGQLVTPAIYLMAACMIVYLFSLSETYRFQLHILNNQIPIAHGLSHAIAAFVLAYIYFRLIKLVRTSADESKNSILFSWLLSVWGVIYLSYEVNLLVLRLYYSGPGSVSNISQAYIRTGLPILWGLCSFVFMWLGMKFKYRPLRIISLTLFSITLVKLFAFDIRDISAGGKIAAFFCLGVLLLIISFMYQRLKKIIIEDAEKPVV